MTLDASASTGKDAHQVSEGTNCNKRTVNSVRLVPRRGRTMLAELGIVGAIAIPQFLDDIIATGFTALTIDKFGYVDRAKQLEADVTAIIGSEPLRDSAGRWATYDLAEFAAARASVRGQLWMRDRATTLLGDDIDQVIDCATGDRVAASGLG
jgi:hypothetical protein